MSLLSEFKDIIQLEEPLSMYTWFQLGGTAEFFAEPKSREVFLALVQAANEEQIPVRILGSGSNVLVRDEGVRGLVIRMVENLPYEILIEDTHVTASGNVPLGRLVTSAVRAGLGGLEEMIGIPGTLGGALHGNAGTDTTDIGQHLLSATVLLPDGTVSSRQGSDLIFGYRQSSLDDCVVLDAKFEFHPENPVELAQRMQKLWIIRKAMQPMGHQCAGRIFKNSTESGLNANEIIESAGLKGTRIGGAVVCERHANYIVTDPECTTSDVFRLISFIKDEIQNRTGIALEMELEVW